MYTLSVGVLLILLSVSLLTLYSSDSYSQGQQQQALQAYWNARYSRAGTILFGSLATSPVQRSPCYSQVALLSCWLLFYAFDWAFAEPETSPKWPDAPEFELRVFLEGQEPPRHPFYTVAVTTGGELFSVYWIQQYDRCFYHSVLRLTSKQLDGIRSTLSNQEFDSLYAELGQRGERSQLYTISARNGRRQSVVGLFVPQGQVEVDPETSRFLTCWKTFYELVPNSRVSQKQLDLGKVDGVTRAQFEYKRNLRIPLQISRDTLLGGSPHDTEKSYAKDLRTAFDAEICRVGACSVVRLETLSKEGNERRLR